MLKNTPKNIIGVFDSGLGGLTVLKQLIKTLPNYNYIYLGDNARLPYGEKSPATIYEYSREAMDFLFKEGCNLVLIACNTASAQALKKLQQEYLPLKQPNKKILGVIRPLAEEVVRLKIKNVGIIGTKSTINSNTYQKEINNLDKSINVEQKSAPLLVPLIEDGWANKPETKMILKKYLRPLKQKRIQALILGCTHYPFLLPIIKKLMGKKIIVPSPGKIVAESLEDYLNRHPELNLKPTKKTNLRYYTTDDPSLFKNLGEKFLGQKIENINRVKL